MSKRTHGVISRSATIVTIDTETVLCFKHISEDERKMGDLLKASCSKCGFVSEDLFVGFGFKGAGDHYMEPSICPKCHSFSLKDRRHPPQMCRRCQTEVVFYGDRRFSTQFFTDPLRSEKVAEDTTEELTEGNHICPQCGEVSLTFENIGRWD